jgi:hypothetical protein
LTISAPSTAFKMSCDLNAAYLVQKSAQGGPVLPSTPPSMPEAAALAFEQPHEMYEPITLTFKSDEGSEVEEVDLEDPRNVSAVILVGRTLEEISTPEKKQRGRKRKISETAEQPNKNEFVRSEYYEGEIVFARIRGHVTWPARVYLFLKKI